MANYFCVRVRPENYESVSLKYSNSKVTYLGQEEYDKAFKLKDALKGKRNLNFVLYDNQIFKQNLAITRDITGRSAINSSIFAKLQKDTPGISDLRYKYTVAEDNEKKDEITYAVHGIYTNSASYNKVEQLDAFSDTNVLTGENYSLYMLSKKLLDKNLRFISVWVDEKSLSIVAGDHKELYYSRNENLASTNQSVEQEIIKNITFAQQRVRGLRFDLVMINGSVVDDTKIYRSVYEQIGLSVATFYHAPDLFKNFDEISFNKYMIHIGSLFIEYEFDFISSAMRSKKQYNIAQNYLIGLLALTFLFGLYNTYDIFKGYSLSSNYYHGNLDKISLMVKDLNIEDEKNKNNIYSMMELLNKEKQYELLVQMEHIKKNIELINSSSDFINLRVTFDSFKWEKDNISKLNVTQEYLFKDISELNRLRSDLELIELKIQKDIEIKSNFSLNNLSSTVNYTFYGVLKEGETSDEK